MTTVSLPELTTGMLQGLARWLRYTRSPMLWLATMSLFACSSAPAHPGSAERLDPDAEIAPFVKTMVSRYGFERAQLEQLLRGVRVQPEVLEAIARPAESLD